MDNQQEQEKYNIGFFKRWAPIYYWIEVAFIFLRKKVANKIGKSHAKILDVACGTGSQSVAFAKEGHSVIGVDLSPDMLKYTERKIKPGYDVKFVRGNATKLPYDDSTFDVSSVSLALHEMPEDLSIMTLKEMIRVTKEGGQILIIEYNTPPNRLGHKIAKLYESKYYNHFVETGLDYFLKKAGLEPISKETCLLGNFQTVECTNRLNQKTVSK
ncbi:MAG: class I SAM-dependent methyltransferase [Patescibacteria group bacterium]|nr:class I SAM-dependent methyltransferase [Patescibacteria group bacterium]